MKRVLVVHFSQSGQLTNIVRSICEPLRASTEIEVTFAELKPVKPYPFPWPFWKFFNIFPDAMYDDPDPIEPLQLPADADYDLIILGFQVWFLSPSMPMAAFLKTEQAKKLLAGKQVITALCCRNMWLSAQERVKERLQEIGAHLIDHVALVDRSPNAATLISTPMWLLTGKRGPFLGGLVPVAGLTQEEIAATARFGHAIAAELPKREVSDHSPMFKGLGAVKIDVSLIAHEKLTGRSLLMWGKLLRACGNRESRLRKFVLGVYVVFLVVLLLTLMPVVLIIKKLLAPLMREKVEARRAYFAAPSGESEDLVERSA
ncbi:MAG TPA: dialkylresorcinol condensing enzyme [Steroidobacteraceae bacterium]|nr:dialkylresorcinol condensing enzyme [Steroidobacteraceae bacterium]